MSEDLVAQSLTALRRKDFAAARNFIAAYAAENRLEFQHYLIKGLAEAALADWRAAADTFGEAVGEFPHQSQLWFNLGIAQENLARVDDAAESYERSLDLKAGQGDACGNLSNIYRQQGRFAEAETMAHRAYELGAPKAQALNSLGLALGRQGKFEAAAKVLGEAQQLDPVNPHILANLANLAVDQLKFDAAWPLFAAARVSSMDAAIRRDEGMARLLAGDYARGWLLYEARLELPDALRTRPNCPRWNGEAVMGKKLMLVCEQGYGDAIQFCRYGRALVDQGTELFWVVRPALRKLFAMNLPGHVIGEDELLPVTDYWAPIMSLPLATGKIHPAGTPFVPYLKSPAEPKLPHEGTLRKIGLVWAGSHTHGRDHERSIPLEAFAPLRQKVPAQYYAPFVGDGLDEIEPHTPVTPLDHLITDFADTAALLMQLDALVTVDTATAHLAGALGVKTYLLLPWCPDWRWGVNGETTPWYPGMTLLRQPKYGDWDSVMEKLAGLLVSGS